MKKWLFFVLFFLVCLALLYSPLPQVYNSSPDCFSSGSAGFVSHTQIPGEVNASYVYETLPTTEWKFNVFQNQVDVLVKRMKPDGELSVQPISSAEASGSTANCKYLTFDFQREAASPTFTSRLTDETPDESGRKKCTYSLTDVDMLKIAALAGKPISDYSGSVCSDLQTGRASETEDCPQTALCTVNLAAGPSVKYGIGLKTDSCGNRIVSTEGEVAATEIQTRAQSFISTCSVHAKDSTAKSAGAVKGETSDCSVKSGELIFDVQPFPNVQRQIGIKIAQSSGNPLVEEVSAEKLGRDLLNVATLRKPLSVPKQIGFRGDYCKAYQVDYEVGFRTNELVFSSLPIMRKASTPHQISTNPEVYVCDYVFNPILADVVYSKEMDYFNYWFKTQPESLCPSNFVYNPNLETCQGPLQSTDFCAESSSVVPLHDILSPTKIQSYYFVLMNKNGGFSFSYVDNNGDLGFLGVQAALLNCAKQVAGNTCGGNEECNVKMTGVRALFDRFETQPTGGCSSTPVEKITKYLTEKESGYLTDQITVLPIGREIEMRVETDKRSAPGGCGNEAEAKCQINIMALTPDGNHIMSQYTDLGTVIQDSQDGCLFRWTPKSPTRMQKILVDPYAMCLENGAWVIKDEKNYIATLCPFNAEGEPSCVEDDVCGDGKAGFSEDCDPGVGGGGEVFKPDKNTCSKVNPVYIGGDLHCSNDCKFVTHDCIKNIHTQLAVWTDLTRIKLGADVLKGYPDIKTSLDLNLQEVSDEKLPKKAVFATNVQGGSFVVDLLLIKIYANPFMGGWAGTLVKYAETTPDLFALIKQAQDSGTQPGGNFVPTGPLASFEDDNVTIRKIYSDDLTFFNEIDGKKIEAWFNGNVVVTLDFNEDGSANVKVDSSITGKNPTTDEVKYSITKAYTTTVDSDTAKRILNDMIIRFALAKDESTGATSGTPKTVPVPDLSDLIDMIKYHRFIVGNKIALDGEITKRLDYINPASESSRGKVYDFISELLNYWNTLKDRKQVSASDESDVYYFGSSQVV
jgi:hypothetical protein